MVCEGGHVAGGLQPLLFAPRVTFSRVRWSKQVWICQNNNFNMKTDYPEKCSLSYINKLYNAKNLKINKIFFYSNMIKPGVFLNQEIGRTFEKSTKMEVLPLYRETWQVCMPNMAGNENMYSYTRHEDDILSPQKWILSREIFVSS